MWVRIETDPSTNALILYLIPPPHPPSPTPPHLLQDLPLESDEEEDEDWATSDEALSNLEERLMRWHNSFNNNNSNLTVDANTIAVPKPVKKLSTAALTASTAAPAAPPSGDHCVVKLHRFHFAVSACCLLCLFLCWFGWFGCVFG